MAWMADRRRENDIRHIKPTHCSTVKCKVGPIWQLVGRQGICM